MSEKSAENPMTIERKQVSGPEVKPITGGAQWLVLQPDELDNLSNAELKSRLAKLDRKPDPILEARPELLADAFIEIDDLVSEGQIPEDEAALYLGRITQKLQEVGAREEQRKTREAMEKVAAGTPHEARRRAGREIQEHKEGALGWLRERINELEAREIGFSSRENQYLLEEIHAVLNDLPAELQKEYWARRYLHDYTLIFLGSPDVETARNAAGAISMGNLKLLVRLPAVAEAFREYERRARLEREAFEDIREGRRNDPIHQDELFVTTEGEQVDRVRKQIEQKAGSVVAQRIAERIWHITGRSSYWNAYTYVGSPGDKREDFKSGQGKGALTGAFYLGRLYNLRENLKAAKPSFQKFWFEEGQVGPDGEQSNYFDFKTYDFWTTQFGKFTEEPEADREEELEKKEREREIEIEGLHFDPGQVEQIGKDERGFLNSLEDFSIESLELTHFREAQYGTFMNDLNNADKARAEIARPKGFLELPTPQNYAKLGELFIHVREKDRDEIMKRFLWGMIQFNKKGGMLEKPQVKKQFPDWVPWDKELIEAAIRKSVTQGLITSETGKKLLNKTVGGRLTWATKKETKNILISVGEGLIEGLRVIFKSSLK